MALPRELTDAQKKIAHEKSGLFAVKACPGSGKTFTVAARLHRLLSNWKRPHVGIAAISFTNTAWLEIEGYIANDFGLTVPLSYPHFLGTIDSFINRFIFLPFGHMVMGCQTRPELTGPPHDNSEPIGNWLFWRNGECNRNSCRLNDFSYDENGQLVHIAARSHFNNCQSGHARCQTLKHTFTSAGYATQADANYFAMKLLLDLPELAEALAHRFPVIIIDEAQDTSAIQMHILDSLVRGGLSEVMLVGDPYQAIYEWRQAAPRLFENKFNEWGGNCIWLSENWRSTQSICDLACRLACSSQRIIALNPGVAPYDGLPRLYGYSNEAELPQLLEDFRQYCSSRGISASQISILTRSSEFSNAVIPGSAQSNRIVPWRDDDALTRQIAQAKYLFDRGSFREALHKLEVVVYKHVTDRKTCIAEDIVKFGKSVGLGKWRGGLFEMLQNLPPSNNRISEWLPFAQSVTARNTFLADSNLQIKRDYGSIKYSELTFTEVFSVPAKDVQSEDPVIGTVHSVKGRGLETVFLALKSKGASGRKYVNLLGSSLLEEEELRIVYVAITRAKKALGLAVPANDIDRWRDFLIPAITT